MAAHALGDDSVQTQGNTVDEIAANICDVAIEICGDNDIYVELMIPSNVKVA
ncbi:MAG: hypothetical protein HY287_01195 [Planctomycetes bacterium]|nr:hypothetical protein [Planctomycetota bacterium]